MSQSLKIKDFDKIWLLFPLCLIISLVYTVFELRLYKLLFHEARFIKESEAIIYNKQGELKNSKVFHYFEPNGDPKIVVYLENIDAYMKRNIIIIDKNTKEIGTPNSNIRDYSLWGNYLFQNNSGEYFIPFDNSKRGDLTFNPSLNIASDKITFNLPKNQEFNHESIVIKLRPHSKLEF